MPTRQLADRRRPSRTLLAVALSGFAAVISPSCGARTSIDDVAGAGGGPGAGGEGAGGQGTGGQGAGGQLPTERGCASGVRAGFIDERAFPGIAACAGRFEGNIDEASASALCSAGWSVCRGDDAAVHAIELADAVAFRGCFAFDAANDCGSCFETCRGSIGTCKACCVPNDPDNPDMAGMGAACQTWPDTSCLASGRVDAHTNQFGCMWEPSLSGVVCCER